jgi:hypothetical protein
MPAIYVSAEAHERLPARHPLDHYKTPLPLARAAIGALESAVHTSVLDPGAGSGVWGEAVRERYSDARVVGVELDERFAPHESYDEWHQANFLSWDGPLFSLVVGNPPYKVAEAFVRKALSHLLDGGECVLLLKTEFQNSDGRAKGLWAEFPPYSVRPLAQRPSFNGTSKTQAQEYCLYYWRRPASDEWAATYTRWRPLSWR